MRRTGSSPALVTTLALLLALPALGAFDFSQSADRAEVGTEDTFRLTVTVEDPPEGAELEMPETRDFEMLSSSQSTQRSIEINRGVPVMRTLRKYLFLMRARRPGTLGIPPAVLRVDGRTFKTEALTLKVKKGQVNPPSAQHRRGGPFSGFPLPHGMPDPFGDEMGFPELDVPRGDSDLFLKAMVDRDTVYVGEQVTLSVYIFSRVDLSSVDSTTMPKLDGFWSEDIESPTQLSAEQRTVNGVPYRAYLLRRRALFPVKPGTLTISAADADITTGFLFAGHRVHRSSSPLTITAKPLPPGLPKGMSAAQVGSWQLSVDVSQRRVQLGEPVTVKVVLEGTGNVRNVTPPRLTGPASLKIYDPTTDERVTSTRGRIQGRRVHEYLVVPQQTGTFTLPELRFAYFDPKAERYEVATTEPVPIVVEPGAGTAPGAQVAGASPAGPEGPKNVLAAGGRRPLRFRARFESPSLPPWRQAWFAPALAAPVALWAAAGLLSRVRAQRRPEHEAQRSRAGARAARKRLAAAEALRTRGTSEAFYGEVERGLTGFLEAKLGVPVAGLTREVLDERLAAAGVVAEKRSKVLFVLDACDAGRFAPGAELSARERVLEEAGAAMEGWGA